MCPVTQNPYPMSISLVPRMQIRAYNSTSWIGPYKGVKRCMGNTNKQTNNRKTTNFVFICTVRRKFWKLKVEGTIKIERFFQAFLTCSFKISHLKKISPATIGDNCARSPFLLINVKNFIILKMFRIMNLLCRKVKSLIFLPKICSRSIIGHFWITEGQLREVKTW